MKNREYHKEYMRKYRLTKKGLLVKIYTDQVKSSKYRGHPLPQYSRKEFYEWAMSQTHFHHLYHLWKISNFDNLLKPSIDRIDDFIPYTFSNIRIVTWMENRQKQYEDILNGTGTSGLAHCKSVIQYDKDGLFVNRFHSASAAGRETDINFSHILAVCKGKRRTAGGYMWKFKDDIDLGGTKPREIKKGFIPVIQFSKDDEFIDEYESATSAAEETGFQRSKITAVCRGRRKTTGGYKWKYKFEEEKIANE